MTTSQRQTSQWPYVTVCSEKEYTDSDVSIYLGPRRVHNSVHVPLQKGLHIAEFSAMALNGQKNLLVTVHEISNMDPLNCHLETVKVVNCRLTMSRYDHASLDISIDIFHSKF